MSEASKGFDSAPSSAPAHRAPPIVYTAELDVDPHTVLKRYRPIAPVVKRDTGAYLAIRAADVEGLITDPRTRQVETELAQIRGLHEGALFDFYKHSMLFSNGPDHRRRRMPLTRVFALKLIEQLRPRIRATAEQLLDEARADGGMNFLDRFCSLIPARIISDILGIEARDIPRFTAWVYSMARSINSSYSVEEIGEIEAATRELTTYVGELIESRRLAPREDFLTSFAQAVEEEGNLSPLETLVQLVTVILAGSDTTRTALAIQTDLLLKHPEQWQAVCRDAALIPGAVLEAMRYEPSVGSIPRFTVEDLEIEGYCVPRNAILSLSTLSAMRDESRYSEPDRFDITRTDHPKRHLIFGGGVHRCLGEALAKAELEEGLMALAARVPNLRIVGEPPRMIGHSGIRRMTGMQVAWD
jgi:cytochrome P450